MRILHELQMGRKVRHIIPPYVPLNWNDIPGGIDAALVTDNVSAWYWASGKSRWDLKADFGPLRLPFDVMWIEHAIPASAHTLNAIPGAESTYNAEGSLLVQFESDTIMIRTVARSRGHGLCAQPYAFELKTNDDGSYKEARVHWDADDGTMERLAGRPMSDLLDHVVPHEPLLAVGMANCRNVTLGDERPAKQATRSIRHCGQIPYAINTLIIPGFARANTNRQARDAAGAPIPLHLVRGHFKTYTEDAPLFGSRTGTYWWGWQTRGKKEHGVRDHEYVVRPPNEAA